MVNKTEIDEFFDGSAAEYMPLPLFIFSFYSLSLSLRASCVLFPVPPSTQGLMEESIAMFSCTDLQALARQCLQRSDESM